jgi:hypothetical protein
MNSPPTRIPESWTWSRVKQAVVNVAARHGVVKDPPAPSFSIASIFGYTTTIENMDAEIAREYAALRSEIPRTPPSDTPK